MKIANKAFLALGAFLVPTLAFAQQLDNVSDLVSSIGRIVGLATPIIVGIALLVFFWGLVRFIFAAGDPEKRKESRGLMIWGAVAIFVIVSIFGIVEFIGNAFDIDQGGTFDPVGVQGL